MCSLFYINPPVLTATFPSPAIHGVQQPPFFPALFMKALLNCFAVMAVPTDHSLRWSLYKTFLSPPYGGLNVPVESRLCEAAASLVKDY